MAAYRVFLPIDLLESMPKKAAERRRIMEFIRRLQDSPRTRGDYTDKTLLFGSARSR
jgi:hypothetical protein